MKHIRPSLFCFLFLSFSLLISSLPLAAMIEPLVEVQEDVSLISLNPDRSELSLLLAEIALLDKDDNSLLELFNRYIDQGIMIAEKDAFFRVLDYIDTILASGNDEQSLLLRDRFENLVDQVVRGELDTDVNDQVRSHLPLRIINARLLIKGKSIFDSNVIVEKKLRVHERARFYKTVHFKNNVKIDGVLSVSDIVADSVATDSLMLTGGLVINDLTLHSLTAMDIVVDDLQVNNCVSNLCVDNLTVTSGSVSGTLSINDAVIQTLDFSGGLIINDLTLNTLTATDIVVDNANVANDIHLLDATGGEYIGLKAPSVVSSSYTLELPANAPMAYQVLRANTLTPTNLEWAAESGFVTPAVSKTIYVTKYGNDITGDGSFNNPFLTLAKAVDVANSLASLVNPIVIWITSGIYVEDNSAGPLAITVPGVSIVGESVASVIIMPGTPSNPFLSANSSLRMMNVTLQSSSSLGIGLQLLAGELSTFNNMRIVNFDIGVSCSGGPSHSYGFSSCLFLDNNIAIDVNNARVELNVCSVFGVSSLYGPAAHKGIKATGAGAGILMSGGVIGLCDIGYELLNDVIFTACGVSFKLNKFDIDQTAASQLTLVGCSCVLTNGLTDIDVKARGAGTVTNILGCEFNGNSILGVQEGTGVYASDNAVVNISGGTFLNYGTAIHIGEPGDTSATEMTVASVIIRGCNTDILQEGSASIDFNTSSASGSKIILNDPTNVSLAYFDVEDNKALVIGSTANVDTTLLKAEVNSGNNPHIDYQPSLYSSSAIGVHNPLSTDMALYISSTNDAGVFSISQDRTKTSLLRLVSDEGSPVGGASALRGWDIAKNPSTAELSFSYQNSDAIGQSIISPYTIAQFDGVNNQVQLPHIGTHIVFAGDTNLYRYSANVLKTDDNFIVGTLMPSRAVVTDGSNQLSSSVTTATEVSYLSGVTSPVQTQLNNKVSRSGDTMTGTLQLPAGTSASPSLIFTGSTTTGLSANVGDLSLNTNGLERMKVSSGGVISINGFTTAGVVHNDASGNLSSSLIVNADIASSAGIIDTKLATISTADKVANSATTATSFNTSNAIVSRDVSGNFSAGTITAHLNGNAATATIAGGFSGSLSGDVTGTQAATVVSFVGGQSAANVAAATVALNEATNTNIPSTLVKRDVTGSFAAQTISLVDEVATGSITVAPFTSAGVVHNNAFGLLSSSLIVNADVDSAAGIIDTKLATISTAGKVANSATTATGSNIANTIVSRDASCYFSAGTITANLTGSASNNVLKSGDTMTGALNMATQNEVRFQDAAGGEYVGITAPSTVNASYTLSFPSTTPTANQYLKTGSITPNDLEWITTGGSTLSVVSRSIYVAQYGNDVTGDGSFDFPYATLAKAVDVANSLSTASNPMNIIMFAGAYVEDNTAGPLTVTAEGISIISFSAGTVVISPLDLSKDLLLATKSLYISDITLAANGVSTARGLVATAGNFSSFFSLQVFGFQVGIECSGGSSESYGFNSCLFANNGIGLFVNNTIVECDTCTIFGADALTSTPANTGILIDGAQALCIIGGGTCSVCSTGILVQNNAKVTCTGVPFGFNKMDVEALSGALLNLSSCTFEFTIDPADVDLHVAGVGTKSHLLSCNFMGKDSLGNPQGEAILVEDSAIVETIGGSIDFYTTGVIVGNSFDTAATQLALSGFLIHNCVTDVQQNGSSSLTISGSSLSSDKVIVNDATNVSLSFFDLNDSGAFTIGSGSDQDTTLLQPYINQVNHPSVQYKSSLYSSQAIGFENLFGNPASWFVESDAESKLVAITTVRTDAAGLRLVSDTGSPFGGTSALRGWDINKNATTAELSFNYQNSDIVGQAVVSPYTVMQLDGLNNQVQLPTAGTKIVFSADTNLYRDSADVLKTDDSLIVGTLTAGRAMQTNVGTNQLESSVVTNAELGYLSGVTSSVQTQLSAKVAKTGDIMTGALQLPAGTIAVPSLVFTGSTTTGFSAATANTLSLSTNAVERMKISSTGTVSINQFGTAGVVHNDASGNLTSSLIVDADITNATISNTKLATISSLDVPGAIVVRDGSGNFSTNMITIDGAVTNPTDVATKAYVDAASSTGLVVKTPALVASATDTPISGLYTIDGIALVASDRVLLIGQSNPIENGLWQSQVGAWTRPVDFVSGSTAEEAYVLVTSGNTYAGASWVCDTPTATIDTDSLGFEQFSLSDTTTGLNIGAGTGLVFKNKMGVSLNFRSLLEDTHVSIATNSDDITISTDATDANTSSTIVARDASGNFSAGTITANVIGSASNNVLKAGDTMIGTLTLPAGTTSVPSLTFTGSTTSGFSASGDDVSISTGGIERMKISSGGVVSIDQFIATGVVHNDASGSLLSSLIVNADIDPAAAIVDTKLATISAVGKVSNSATTATSSNMPNAIVLRDGLGNFNVGTVIGNLTGSASSNVLKVGDTMTGALQLPAGTPASPSLTFTGSTTAGLSATAGNLSFDTSGSERMKISSSGVVSVNSFITAGVVHNDASGNLSSSLIVNADVSPIAAIIDTKLATISTAGKVANSATTATSSNTVSSIVARDASGNFSAGTITAHLNGNAATATTAESFSGSLLGDVTGTQAETVVSFVGGQSATNIASATTAASAATNLNTADTIVKRDGTGSFAAQTISLVDEVVTGSITVAPFNIAGVVHNNASGLLLSSLIVNADVDSAAGIVDTKLATISTVGKVANSATTATSSNVANTIISRDASGNFSSGTITANLTGSASNNVLKAGDTMAGALNMAMQNEVRFQDTAGGGYVGLNASVTVPASYTLSLPSVIPSSHQVMRADDSTPTNLEWYTPGSSVLPVDSRTIYVAEYGNDITGDGSQSDPYASLAKAIDVANGLSTISNPITIEVESGVYIEDNSAGPLTITAQGISIVGSSATATTISPSTLSNTLLLSNEAVLLRNMQFVSNGISTSTGISLANGVFNELTNARVAGFQVGLECSGGLSSSYGINNCLFVANGTGLMVSDTIVQSNNSTYAGTTSLVGPAANIGISITGANSNVVVNGGTCLVCSTGINVNNNAKLNVGSVQFKLNVFDVVQTTASQVTLSSCSFSFTEDSTDIDMQVSGAGTVARLFGCDFNGHSMLGTSQGIALKISDNATVLMDGCGFSNYTTAIALGLPLDTSSTILFSTDSSVHNCINDIEQQGTSSLNYIGGAATSSKIIVNDSTNVSLSFFDLGDNSSLTIGSLADQDIILLQALVDPSNNTIDFEYKSSLYGAQSIGIDTELPNPTSLFVVANNDATLDAITTLRTDIAGVRLASDTGVPVGGISALRGWDINKNGTSAELLFNYQNSDTIGQAVIPQYTIMQLDGVNNQVQLPTAGTKIIFNGDTNLYRDSTNVLKTDDNLIIGTLTPDRVVQTNVGTNQLESSVVTNTELGNLSGVTSSIQTQLNNKVSRSGDIMTGVLQLPVGTTAAPSFVFTGSTTTGLSAPVVNTLSFSTNAAERMKISASGVVAINAFSVPGVVHNDASGNLSSSLIVDADVSPMAAIVDTKLATIVTSGKVANSATTATSSNTASAIVSRDASGNFTTNMIALTGAVINPTDATTKAYVDSTVVAVGTNLNTPNTLVKRDDTGSFSAQVVSLVDEVISGNISMSDSTSSTVGNINKAGVRFIHNFGANNTFVGQSSGNFTMSGAGLNTGLGVNTLKSNTTGAGNAAVGFNALTNNTIGSNNNAMGYFALSSNTTGISNIAIGNGALQSNTTGSENTAVGHNALNINTTGNQNTAIGYGSLDSNTTGIGNVAIGYSSLNSNLASYNVGVGFACLFTNTTGAGNVAIGVSSLSANTTGTNNTAVGKNTLLQNTIGAQNTAVGSGALQLSTIGINNTSVGYNAGNALTTGSNNVLLGSNIAASTTTGSNNIYIDGNSLNPANESDTIRIGNTQVSAYLKGVYGVSVASPQFVTVGSTGQLGSTTSAGIGTNLNTPNTLVFRDGTGSFATQTISLVDEVISGNISMRDSTSATVGNINKAGIRFIHNFGANNTFVGKGSGNFALTGTGNNTVMGAGSLAALTSGNQNTIIGATSGTLITSGNSNIIIGYNAGINTTTGDNNIYLDSSGGASPANENNTIRIGNNQTKTCFIKGIRGTTTGLNNATAVLIDSQGQLGTVSSSMRFKHNVQDMADISSALFDLRPVTFAYNSDATESAQFGLIAEEVSAAFPELVVYDEDGLPYTVRYEVLPALLLNEVQKQKKRNDQYDIIIQGLLDRVSALEAQS